MFSCVWCISKYFSKNIFWCLEKKKEEAKPRKTRTNPEEHGVISRSTVRSRIASDGAILDCDWWRDLAKRRSRLARPVLREIAISDRDRRRDLAKRRSRSVRTMLCARLRRSISRSFSLSFSLCASSLCVSPVSEIIWSENRNENEFPWSTLLFYGQLKMIFGKFNFPNQPNSLFYGKWFPETIFTQNKHSLRCCSLDSFQPCGFFSYRMKMYF